MHIVEAYNLVIADIEQDIGYVAGVQETTLSVLRGRLYEINHVHPNLFDKFKQDDNDDVGDTNDAL
jgi:hypothetical protein